MAPSVATVSPLDALTPQLSHRQEEPHRPVLFYAKRRATITGLFLDEYFHAVACYLPGGGFAGGLLAATGVCFAAVVQGAPTMRAILGCNLRWLIGGGLVIAIISALLPLFGNMPFTGLWTRSGATGETIKVGTPLLFDIGVYLLVMGVTCAFVKALLLADHMPPPSAEPLESLSDVDQELAQAEAKSNTERRDK